MSNHARAEIAQRLATCLDRSSDVPLHRQLVECVWREVITGLLETGERLPTIRQLAVDLSVHPNTVRRAYDDLTLRGVVVTRPGEGTFVVLKSDDRSQHERALELERLCGEMVDRAGGLGFKVDDLIDALAELRSSRPHPNTQREAT